jgi:hypothetical protein
MNINRYWLGLAQLRARTERRSVWFRVFLILVFFSCIIGWFNLLRGLLVTQ